MIGKRIKNKIKNFELLKKKEGKKLANIGVITLLLLSVLSTLFLPYANSDEIDAQNIPTDTTHYAKVMTNFTDYQTITLTGDIITRLELHIAKYGSVTDNLNISIYDGYPWNKGTTDVRTISISPSSIPTWTGDWDNVSWYEWNFTDFTRHSSVYTIELNTSIPWNDDDSAEYLWQKNDVTSNPNPYPDGNYVYYTTQGGAGFVNVTNADMAFKVYATDFKVEDLSAFGRAKSVVYDDNEDALYVFYFDNSHRSADTHLCLKKLWLSNNTWSSKFTFPEPYYKVGGNMYGEKYEHHITVAAQIDNNNYIWLIYGGHANADHPICSVRSNYPIDSPSFVWNDNSSWSAPVTVETDTDSSYPITYVSHNNTYCLYMRKGGLSSDTDSYMVVYWSFDNGTTWNSRVIADEAYSMTEWTYDAVNGKDLLFLVFGNSKTAGSSFTNTNFDFIWTTLNDIINGTGAYTSQQDVGDTPYYTFPVAESDILTQDKLLSYNRNRYYNIQFDANTRNVYLAMGNDTDGNAGSDVANLFNKTLGTTNAWQITEIQNDTTLGNGDMYDFPCDILFVGNKMFMLTLYNDTQAGDSGTYWKLRYGETTTPTDNSSWTWTNITSRYPAYGSRALTESFLIPMDNNHIGFQIQVGRDNVTYTYDYGMVKYATIGDINYSPTISNPSPSDGATDVSVSLSSWSCDISDADGDTMNWTIQTSPNIGSNSRNNAPNGSISCPLSGLQYSTSYTVYVNVTDGTSWTNNTYTFTTAAEKYFTDSGTAEPMTFPDTLPNSGLWVNATGNLLVITNNYGTIDGTNSWIKLQSAVMYNETNDEIIYAGTNGIHLWARINDGSWHNITARDGDGCYILNDSVWDYTFDVGDTLIIKEEVYIQNCTGCDPAGYYTSYYMNKYYPGFWQVVNSTSNITEPDYWNATITLAYTGNAPPSMPSNPNPDDYARDVTIYYPSFSFHTGDTDSSSLTCKLYINGTLMNSKYLTNISSDMTISISCPQILEAGVDYTWYVTVSDGTDTVTSSVWHFTTVGENTVPILYNSYPPSGSVNISLMPTLSVWVYDSDSDAVVIGFYDDSDNILGIDRVNLSDNPGMAGQASYYYSTATDINTTYQWYVIANDGDGNAVRYPTTGYLNFTTGITYPPVITFQVKDTSGFPLSDVNISCSNLNQQILQYATTNTGGFASFSFNYNDIGQTYDFVFKKANYTTIKKTYTIATGQYYITLQHKATPTGDDTTNPTDIATIFVNYAQDSLGSTGLAFLSIILVILAMLIASKQFNAGNTTTLFIGASLFGLFIALGWIPFWLLLLPLVLVALMFGGKIRDIIFGKSTGGDES